MPKVTANPLPDCLVPYRWHGVEFSWQGGTRQAEGDCPHCGKAGKWYAAPDNGAWSCKVCGEGGNVYTFLRLLHEEAEQTTPADALAALAKDRRLLSPVTLQAWGVCQSPLSGDWLMPGYNAEGKLTQLYQYRRKGERMTLLPTPTLAHAIHLPANYDTSKPEVWVCEGPWDGMALWEVLRQAKRTEEGGLTLTGNEEVSLAATVNVVAVPGCGSIGDPFRRWLPLFAGKQVTLCFDSDHPREHEGKMIEPAGYSACRRAAGLLTEAVPPPAEVRYLCWGEQGFDPDRKSGYDVRDLLTEVGK